MIHDWDVLFLESPLLISIALTRRGFWIFPTPRNGFAKSAKQFSG
jgi:hypothetical protein